MNNGNIPGFVRKQILSRNLSGNMSINRFSLGTFPEKNVTFPYYLEMFQIKKILSGILLETCQGADIVWKLFQKKIDFSILLLRRFLFAPLSQPSTLHPPKLFPWSCHFQNCLLSLCSSIPSGGGRL